MLRKFAFPVDKVLELIENETVPFYEFNGKKYANIIIKDNPEPDQFGKDFVVEFEKKKEDWKNKSVMPVQLCSGKFQFLYHEKEAINNGTNPKEFGGHDNGNSASVASAYGSPANKTYEPSDDEDFSAPAPASSEVEEDDLPF